MSPRPLYTERVQTGDRATATAGGEGVPGVVGRYGDWVGAGGVLPGYPPRTIPGPIFNYI